MLAEDPEGLVEVRRPDVVERRWNHRGPYLLIARWSEIGPPLRGRRVLRRRVRLGAGVRIATVEGSGGGLGCGPSRIVTARCPVNRNGQGRGSARRPRDDADLEPGGRPQRDRAVFAGLGTPLDRFEETAILLPAWGDPGVASQVRLQLDAIPPSAPLGVDHADVGSRATRCEQLEKV